MEISSKEKAVQKIEPMEIQKRPFFRVAGYCRVSTDFRSQETSIENQRIHYAKYISEHPDWVLVGIYWEKGVSGLKADKRPQLQRLLKDCEAGMVDLIITKSISRFSRNTADCLEMVRRLTARGVILIFEKENIDTSKMTSELMLTLLSAFAESESRSISGNMKWGIRKRFLTGSYIGAKVPYGYKRIENEYVIDPVQADAVRRIFYYAMEGKNVYEIAKVLNAEEIPTWMKINGKGDNKNEWSSAAVRSVIKNPFYAGDSLYQKTFVDTRYNQRKNEGQQDRYLKISNHPAIIDREIFCRANEMIEQCEGCKDEFNISRYIERFETEGSNVMAVKVIRATRPEIMSQAQRPVLRVAAYCRVSTDSDEQEISYEAQVKHYSNYITGHEGWTLAGIYADEGLSGTQAKTRPRFNDMIEACEKHQIDMIITKSISRFARNTLDCLNYIRKLKDLEIPIIFEKESANTMEQTGELLITILASIAQQESASISQNVRMGINFGFQEGRGRLNYSTFLGYKRGDGPGTYVIVPEEANVVRRIYREYLEGYSPNMIALNLMKDKIQSPAGREKWYASTVSSILENEKYCGDLLMQKYYVKDFLTHKIVKNTGERPKYFVEDDHEPIVPKEIFFQVQNERKRRSCLRNDPSNLRFGSQMALSGRLICGKCKRTLKRYVKPDPGLTDWRCRKRAMMKKSNKKEQPGAICDCRIVKESDVCRAVLTAFNMLAFEYRDLLKEREKDLKNDESNDLSTERSQLAFQEMQIRILTELMDDMIPSQTTGQRLYYHTKPSSAEKSACYEKEDFFKRTKYSISSGVLDRYGSMVVFDNDLVVRYLDRVVIEDDGYAVIFKAGLTIWVGIEMPPLICQYK